MIKLTYKGEIREFLNKEDFAIELFHLIDNAGGFSDLKSDSNEYKDNISLLKFQKEWDALPKNSIIREKLQIYADELISEADLAQMENEDFLEEKKLYEESYKGYVDSIYKLLKIRKDSDEHHEWKISIKS